MEQKHFLGCAGTGFHRVAYTEWGDPADPCPVVCVHGLTRNGRDFDPLAAALAAAGRRVVCPDIVGRGRSAWAADAAAYTYPQYCADMVALIARLDAAQVDWIGTSMGGLIGMLLAGMAGTPLRRLVMNDIGPFIPAAFLARLGGYLGTPVRFASIDEAEAYLREIHAPFGALTDAQWRHLAEHGVRRTEEGDYALAYDPRIAEAFRGGAAARDVDMWAAWAPVRLPVLVVRGAWSDLLAAEVVAAMRERHPDHAVDELLVGNAGHAPALMADDQIAAVRDWICRS